MTDVVQGGEGVVLAQEQIKTASQSPQHLRAWLDASNRRWLVFNGLDLVDALAHPWPEGVERFMATIVAYRDHRRTIDTGRVRRVEGRHPKTGERYDEEVRVFKGELLEVEELDRAIRYLVAQILDKDPAWSLEKPAL